MAKITNNSLGLRGIVVKDNEEYRTIWLAPGQSEDIDKTKIVEPLPDLDPPSSAIVVSVGEDRMADLEAENAELRAQLAALDRDGDGKPGGSQAKSPPGLTNKSKADLLAIAAAENVAEVSEENTVEDIKTAIELKREADAQV